MKATVNEVNLTFASVETDYLRTAAAHTDTEIPFEKIPGDVTPEEVRKLRQIIESALNSDDESRSENSEPLIGRAVRTELLRMRKQLKQVENGIEVVENVY